MSFGSPTAPPSSNSAPPIAASDAKRIDAFVRQHYAFTWRVLRRAGLSPADADDAAQKVFLIATGRLRDITPGSERGFLFRTAAHIASKFHRSVRQRLDRPGLPSWDHADQRPLADVLLDQRRARDLLDRILSELPADLQAVFVLFEVEGLKAPEVAEALEIPIGTVASRLRRARAEVSERVQRYQTRARFERRLR